MVAEFYEGVVESFNFVTGKIEVLMRNLTDRNDEDEVWIIPTSILPKKQWGELREGSVFYLAVDGKRWICTLGRTKWRKRDIDAIEKQAKRLWEQLQWGNNRST